MTKEVSTIHTGFYIKVITETKYKTTRQSIQLEGCTSQLEKAKKKRIYFYNKHLFFVVTFQIAL